MTDPVDPFSTVLTVLGDTQIFQGLPHEQLVAVAQIARIQSYAKGELLFHQGDEGTGFFIVQSGRVKVFQLSSQGREQILHIFGRGDHFAEVPAFDGHSFPASAAALEQSSVLFFPRQFFLQLLEQTPLLAINMLSSYARHLRRLSQLVDTLSLHEVPGRLATYLVQLRAQQGQAQQFELDVSKGQLASLLGTIPETLSRVFYKLSREGILTVEGSTVTLLDPSRLLELAE